MIDLTTRYLGFTLASPLVLSAGPLTGELDTIRRAEDLGAGAVVLPSLFEEQLDIERTDLDHHLTAHAHAHAEATTYFPHPGDYALGPDAYLEHVRRAKAAVRIPVIASLNGVSNGGWIDFAREMETSLIFLATHGRTGLARLRSGSVAAEVVRHAHCPVVLFRPPELQNGSALASSGGVAAR